jgi:threonine dehydrogenase-like Zn-dependent dehydrogenase
LDHIGVRYVTTTDVPLVEASEHFDPFDLVFECTGYSPLVFEAMQALGKNGVLVLTSVTGGDRRIEVAADAINLGFVLGNKVMVGSVNANREYFEMGVRDFAQCAAQFPGWLDRLLTHPVEGLENYAELIDTLTNGRNTIKVFCNVAPV